MRLFITEKPSVAKALAKEMGEVSPGEGFLRVEDNYITWALGHLFQLAAPEKYNSSFKRWKKADLPIIPKEVQTVSLGKKQLKNIQRLLKDESLTEIVNACDAGREGELIFRWIMESEGAEDKYKKRLWLSSLTPGAIQEGLDNLLPAKEFSSLAKAAKLRAEADWLLGINATRAATLSLSRMGVVSLGRVQTPTLALLVQREKEREKFSPETFWTVRVLFRAQDGEYLGEHEAGRISKERAAKIKEALASEAKITEIKSQQKSEEPPLLYDLTALQREASSKYSWPAKKTLSVAQALYEEEKVLSYPRTDSRFLPEDIKKELLSAKYLPEHPLREDLSRVFNDKKVSDHHAIVPVAFGQHLTGDKKKIFDLVAKRVAAALSPDAVFNSQLIKTKCGSEMFKTSGRVYLSWGWRAFYKEEEKRLLPNLQKGEEVVPQDIRAEESQTKPPPRYSDGTLLGDMETAGKEIEDDEAREAMKERGLGTPATRASIIERLISVDYIEREGKALLPTKKGVAVIDALDSSQLTSPSLTGEWERELLLIERGEQDNLFRSRLHDFVRSQTKELLELKPVSFKSDWGECPGCKRPLQENRAAVSCWTRDDPGCGFALWKKVAGKTLSSKSLKELLKKRKTGPLKGFRSKKGRSFKATAVLKQNKDGSWRVDLEF